MAAPHPLVLITGASTGIGRACALHLARQGFDVLAGIRKTSDGQALERDAQAGPGRVLAIELDVTRGEQIIAAREVAMEAGAGRGLLGLINNAGISVHGPIEFIPLVEWQRQFDVNVFGQIAMTQAMLPLLRQGVASYGRGKARILNIGSIAGRVATPIVAPYSASKFALRALTDALRMEVRPQGIGVCLIEPGAILTPIWGKAKPSFDDRADGPARQIYGSMVDSIDHATHKVAAGAIPVERAAKIIARCLTRRWLPAHRLIGNDAYAAAMAKMWLPTAVIDAGMAWVLGMPRHGRQ